MYYLNYFPYSSSHVMPVYTTMYRSNGEFEKITDMVLNGIKGEATAINFYERLAKIAPSEQARDEIRHALEDEKIHLKQFTKLYVALTGKKPVYKTEARTFHSFKEGLALARKDELEAYEDYRNAYLFTQNQFIRDVFFRALSDEIEHALRFSFLLNELK